MNQIRNFGFKKGDTVLCKKDVYNNDNILTFKSGQSYEVFSTHHFKLDSLIVILYDSSNKKAGSSFTLIGVKEAQNGSFLKFGDYFCTAQEIRKMKLEKLK